MTVVNMEKVIRRFICIVSLLLVQQTYADDVANQQALDMASSWVVSQQNLDGSWGSVLNIQYSTTSVIVDALKASNQYSAAYYAGIAWLENKNTENVDSLARKITSLASRGNNLVADIDLLNASKADPTQAGWGLSVNYQNDALDTVLALTALVNTGDASSVTPVADYLVSIQLLSDGGWSLINNGSSNYLISAHVYTVLATLAVPPPSATSALSNATPYLQAVPLTSNSLILAQTALALLRQPGNTMIVDTMTNELLTRNVSGSWGDLNSTASVMRLLAALLGIDTASYAARANIEDASLRSFLNTLKGNNAFDNITQGDLLELTTLNIGDTDIATLNGLEGAINLTTVTVNPGTDTTAIEGIPGITILIDSDSDGVEDIIDNCPNDANIGQEDFDGDGLGDACDNDQDNDGIVNASDPFPLIPADGDLNEDGQFNAADLLIVQRIALGDLVPTNIHMGHGDVAPLISGIPSPNGLINAADVLVIQRKVMGEINF